MRTAVEARHPGSRPLKDYLKLLRAFDLVYRTDPGYPKTPRAIADEAEIYCEMGKVFATDRYYESAVAAYQFLVDQYPTAATSRDALFAMAEVYRVDLENPEEAAKDYTQFLTRYPYVQQAPEARLRLNEVNRRLAARAAEQARAAEASNSGPAAQGGTSGRVVAVNDVRFWEGPNYTRIVISVEDEAKFQAVRLSHPDRLVFDLPGTRLSHTLAGKAFPVGNGFLQQIRVAQFKPDVTRVVLDLEKIGDYSVFSLPNPFRVIIDVHGPQPLMAARSPAPSPGAGSVAAKPTITSPSIAPASGSAPKPSAAAESRQSSDEPAATAGKPAETANGNVKEYDLSVPVTGAPPADGSGGSGTSATTAITKGTTKESKAATGSAQHSAQTSSGSATLTRALGLKIARIVIDPGHGGHDTGTIGPLGLEEKEVVLDVALRLGKLVEQRMGSDVVMTRSDDTFIPLEERTAIANQRSADLFISIHANASHDPSARGIEVYYLNFTSDPNSLEVAARENSTSQESVYQLQSLIKKIALTEKIEESSEFARQVDHSLESAEAHGGVSPPDRGLKKAPFVVLIGANMPSILAEISFLTNPRDERLLRQPQYRQQIAEGLYRGVAHYVANLGSMRIAQRSDGGLPARQMSSRPAAADPPSSGDSPDF
ncbi:MAG TPA: N-acetylmuramoyl-L-alanine amidase [Terriglobia bacterium]